MGAGFILPLHLWEVARGMTVPWTAAGIGSVLYTGIFASVVALLSYNAAVARIGPSRAVFFLHLMPVFGAGLAVVFLGERLEAFHLIGFPIALGGVLFATSSPPAAAKG
jgi:drug/metabolite transporter (DMT)-like permease